MKHSVYLLLLMIGFATAMRAQSPQFDERERMPSEMLRRRMIQMQAESGLTPDDLEAVWLAKSNKPKYVSSRRGELALQSSYSGLLYDWQYLGPFNQSGRVRATVALPDGQLVIGADGGGIWKMGKDSAWRVKTDTFPSLRITCGAEAPSDPKMIAMGTQEGFLYLSRDSGSTWWITKKAPGANILSIAFHIKDPSRIYVTTDVGLKYTTNQGLSWTTLGGTNRARAVVLHPTDTNIIYFGRVGWEYPYSTTSIMKSTDGGKTFGAIFTGAHGYWSDVLFGLCHDHPNVLWVGLDSVLQYYRSTDAGTNWTQCSSKPFEDGYNKGFSMMAPDPHNPSVLFAGGPGMYRTTDVGATWTRVDKGVHADQHALTFLGTSKAFLGCDGGAYFTNDYTATNPDWHYVSNGLVTLEAYNVAGSPDGQDIVVTGNQDNGYAKYTGDPNAWRIIGGDGFVTLYDRDDPQTVFHEYTDLNLHRASDGFTWWSAKVMNGLPTTGDFYTGIVGEPVDWYGQGITMDPNDPKTLYAGTDSLFKTTNSGDDWELASTYKLTRGGALTAIAVVPGDPKHIYAGSDDGVMSMSTDGGSSWYTVPAAQFLGQQSRFQSIVCDPKDKNVAYAVMQVGPGSKGVFQTTNGGSTWKAIANGLAAVSPSRILVDDLYPDTLFLGTSVGLFMSIDRGANWLPMQNFPNVYVQDLAWHRLNGAAPERTLLVATYGRGIMRGRPAYRFSSLASLECDSVRVGKTRTATANSFLFNGTGAPVQVSAIRLSDTLNFQVENGAAFSLGDGTASELRVTFRPKARGSINATLTYDVNGITQPPIPLHGFGRQVGLQILRHIDFGLKQVGSETDTTVGLTLTGDILPTDTVAIGTATLIGTDASSFSITSPVGQVSTAGLRLRIGYNAMEAGARQALYVLTSDASEVNDTIRLNATGASAGVSDTRIGDDDVGLLSITPNPAGSVASIHGLASGNVWIELTDELGRNVKAQIQKQGESAKLDLTDVTSSTYAVHVHQQQSERVLRLIVRH